MGLDPKQFEKYVLKPTLEYLHPEVPYTENGHAITFETIWHESDGLTYIRQQNDGPAMGLGQMERLTWDDMMRRYIPTKSNLWSKVYSLSTRSGPTFEELAWNLRLSVALTRIRYLPDPHPIPAGLVARAAMWFRVYNASGVPERQRQYIDHPTRLYKCLK